MPVQPIRKNSSLKPLEDLAEKHVTHGLGRITDGVMTEASGLWATFSDGRVMLDFTAGIGVTSLGHCHPVVSKAAAEQCLKVNHVQCAIAFHEPYLRLIEKILPLMPHPSLDSFFFWNSGTEAIEAALRTARIATGRQNIICVQGSYHGRTFGSLAVTKSKTIYSKGALPVMPGVFVTPFPYWHQMGLPKETPQEEIVQQCLYQLELLLAQQTAPSDTAAFLIEPVLGEGGYVPAPVSYLRGVREICDKYGILLIIDEVQSGFGRTGKFFAIEYSGVRPDIMVIAKGIANGFPLSGVVSRKEITDKLVPGSMGGTYAGNAVAMAAACAVADVMQDPMTNFIHNVIERSAELFSALRELGEDSVVGKYILDVRGAGLMVAIEFVSSDGQGGRDHSLTGNEPKCPKGIASRIAKRCVEKGLLILTTSSYEVVRFIPALIITKEEMVEGIKIFGQAVREEVAALTK